MPDPRTERLVSCPRCGGRTRPGVPCPRCSVVGAESTFRVGPSGPGRAAAASAPDHGRVGADVPATVGPYRLIDELGRGGFGVVFRGFDPRLQRPVAVKMIRDVVAADEETVGRFVREARAVARLSHPGIVPVFEVGSDQAGRPFIAMGLVDGPSLETVLRTAPMPAKRIAEVGRAVALALHHAHCHGVVHRDVKSQNILIDASGEPHLVDFGLAGEIAGGEGGFTRTGDIIGTPGYLAPEQALGDRDASGRPPVDVWALGAVLYRAVAGKAPFVGSSALAGIQMTITDDPVRLRSIDPSVPPDLETIVMRCLEKDAAARYPSAAAVAADLGRFLAGVPIEARRPGGFERAVRWARRHRILAACAGVLVVAAVASLGLFVEMRRRVLAERAFAEERRLALLEGARGWAQASWIRFQDAPRDSRTLALGLDAVEAAAAYRAVTLEDPVAVAHAFAVTMAYGEVALSFEQWDVAAAAFARARMLGVDETRAAEAIERVASARSADAEERRAAVDAVIASARAGELRGPRASEDALFVLVARGGLDALERLIGELESITDELLVALRVALSPEDRALSIGEVAALDAWLDAAPGTSLASPDDTRIVNGLFRDRMLRANARALHGNTVTDVRDILADAQRSAVGPAARTVARLCGDALGRLGDARALPALIRHLSVEQDGREAVAVGIAIVRIGRPDAIERVRAEADGSAGGFGRGSRFWREVARYLPVVSGDPSVEAAEDVAALRETAERRFERGELADALADLDRALALEPDHASTLELRGMVRRARGDLEGALEDYDRALALEPTRAATLVNRGNVRMLRGDADGAFADYDAAVTAGPADPSTWANRAAARIERGDLRTALVDLDRSLRLDPDLIFALLTRATCYRALREVERARADLDRALRLQPAHPRALEIRGIVRAESGDLAGADEDLSAVIELRPGAADVWNHRAIVRRRAGDLAGSESDHTRAIELSPRPNYVAGRAQARERRGDLEGAIADWERFVELAPGGPDAATIRAHLDELRARR